MFNFMYCTICFPDFCHQLYGQFNVCDDLCAKFLEKIWWQ